MAYGDGNVYLRKDGYWIGSYELPRNADGKRRRKSVAAKTEELCREKLAAAVAANRPPKPTDMERFRKKYKVMPSGCWEWQCETLYGAFNAEGRLWQAHRYAYEKLVGPIPDGLELDHLCTVSWCVNPDHLEPVTRRENMARVYQRAPMRAAKLAELRRSNGIR